MVEDLSNGILSNFELYILPLIVIISGLLTNMVVITVLSHSRFKTVEFEPARLMNLLALNDIFCLLTLFFTHTTYITPVSFLADNIYFCKIFTFLSLILPAVSSWLTALIGVQRLISVQFTRNNWLTRIKSNLWIVFFIYVYNFSAYSFYLIDNNLVIFDYDINPNLTKSVVYCQPSKEGYYAVYYIFIMNALIIFIHQVWH